MARWPNVPHARGWLALDARGQWFLRDEETQAAGSFPASRGSLIEHEKLRGFIERNYLPDEDGAWYWQNGPQRAYVELEAAPLVWRLTEGAGGVPTVTAHTGVAPDGLVPWLDDGGRLFLQSAQGFGIVHSQDMHLAADAVESGHWQPDTCPFADMPARFGYVLSPAAMPKAA